MLWRAAIFAAAAVSGHMLAIAFLDRIGHRRLQWTGFAVMAACFGIALLNLASANPTAA